MSIVVFWLMTNGEPSCAKFESTQLTQALKLADLHRRQGMSHVTISSEMPGNVGKPGVDTVEDGMTPDGQPYTWSKQGRAGRMTRQERADIEARKVLITPAV